MNYNTVKTFAQKILVAMLLASLGQILIVCGVLGLSPVFIGIWYIIYTATSFGGEKFFDSLLLWTVFFLAIAAVLCMAWKKKPTN